MEAKYPLASGALPSTFDGDPRASSGCLHCEGEPRRACTTCQPDVLIRGEFKCTDDKSACVFYASLTLIWDSHSSEMDPQSPPLFKAQNNRNNSARLLTQTHSSSFLSTHSTYESYLFVSPIFFIENKTLMSMKKLVSGTWNRNWQFINEKIHYSFTISRTETFKFILVEISQKYSRGNWSNRDSFNFLLKNIFFHFNF